MLISMVQSSIRKQGKTSTYRIVMYDASERGQMTLPRGDITGCLSNVVQKAKVELINELWWIK